MSIRIVHNVVVGITAVLSAMIFSGWLWWGDDEKTIDLSDGAKLKMVKVE